MIFSLRYPIEEADPGLNPLKTTTRVQTNTNRKFPENADHGAKRFENRIPVYVTSADRRWPISSRNRTTISISGYDRTSAITRDVAVLIFRKTIYGPTVNDIRSLIMCVRYVDATSKEWNGLDDIWKRTPKFLNSHVKFAEANFAGKLNYRRIWWRTQVRWIISNCELFDIFTPRNSQEILFGNPNKNSTASSAPYIASSTFSHEVFI